MEQLSGLAGRVLFDGWPTGVAVNWAQQHGGPYPATTSLFTSVGATAVRRFQRPVAYQDAPEAVLHPALRDSNPLDIPRRVDGELCLPLAAPELTSAISERLSHRMWFELGKALSLPPGLRHPESVSRFAARTVGPSLERLARAGG